MRGGDCGDVRAPSATAGIGLSKVRGSSSDVVVEVGLVALSVVAGLLASIGLPRLLVRDLGCGCWSSVCRDSLASVAAGASGTLLTELVVEAVEVEARLARPIGEPSVFGNDSGTYPSPFFIHSRLSASSSAS